MDRRYQFKRIKPPQIGEYIWPAAATLPAIGLSVAAVVVLIDPTQRSGDRMDVYALWIMALLSWLVPLFFWSMLRAEWRQFRDGAPVLQVDDQGMSIRNWRGTMLDFRWSAIESFEHVQTRKDDSLLIRAGKTSGSI